MDRDPNTEHKRNAWPSRLARVYLTKSVGSRSTYAWNNSMAAAAGGLSGTQMRPGYSTPQVS